MSTERDIDALARTIMGEAAGEPRQGKIAVGWTVQNRALAKPGQTIAGIATDPAQYNAWSSKYGNRNVRASADSPEYQEARDIAEGILSGKIEDPTAGATSFWSPTTQAAQGNKPPSWANEANLQIGNHMFGRPKGWGPAPTAPAPPGPYAPLSTASGYQLQPSDTSLSTDTPSPMAAGLLSPTLSSSRYLGTEADPWQNPPDTKTVPTSGLPASSFTPPGMPYAASAPTLPNGYETMPTTLNPGYSVDPVNNQFNAAFSPSAPKPAFDVSAPPIAPGPIGHTPRYDGRGVDPRLTNILTAAAESFPLQVNLQSGYRPKYNPDGSVKKQGTYHPKGLATDVEIINPETGKPFPNYQDPKSLRVHEQFAQVAKQKQMEMYPELNDKFRSGIYFSGEVKNPLTGKGGKYGATDLMHFDIDTLGMGMAGGDWANGLTKAQRAILGNPVSIGMGPNLDQISLPENLQANPALAYGRLMAEGNPFAKPDAPSIPGVPSLESSFLAGTRPAPAPQPPPSSMPDIPAHTPITPPASPAPMSMAPPVTSPGPPMAGDPFDPLGGWRSQDQMTAAAANAPAPRTPGYADTWGQAMPSLPAAPNYESVLGNVPQSWGAPQKTEGEQLASEGVAPFDAGSATRTAPPTPSVHAAPTPDRLGVAASQPAAGWIAGGIPTFDTPSAPPMAVAAPKFGLPSPTIAPPVSASVAPVTSSPAPDMSSTPAPSPEPSTPVAAPITSPAPPSLSLSAAGIPSLSTATPTMAPDTPPLSSMPSQTVAPAPAINVPTTSPAPPPAPKAISVPTAPSARQALQRMAAIPQTIGNVPLDPGIRSVIANQAPGLSTMVQGASAALRNNVQNAGLGAAPSGWSYGWSPFGNGVASVHNSAPLATQIAASGPGIFGAMGWGNAPVTSPGPPQASQQGGQNQGGWSLGGMMNALGLGGMFGGGGNPGSNMSPGLGGNPYGGNPGSNSGNPGSNHLA